ncbi:hypothetical protein C8J55DRAFT_247141 [Lentinula edodes]|uniref:Aprataxin and PNK-like factor PBZ domain-containing protein n=1 Tax=Lentinula lateritia TaxID=40482 RepID=A0A9W8ZTC2_9AGAR|nr:hypothetical protein C8J55DRAFT_247141 [Lentinula edodes]
MPFRRTSPMSNDNRLPVSDDIIDRILLFSPTFSSLQATILTCKSFYHVFQTHPKSIVRAVASNITGPALPQALECIRHPDIAKCSHRFRPPTHWGESDEEDEDEEDGGGGGGSEHSSDDDDDDDDNARAKRFEGLVQETNEQRSRSEENNTRPVGDGTEDILSAPITIEETYKILANAKVVARLEDLFSFRYINRSFSTSQLSASESRDFRVAVYHFMLYSSIFHPGTWNLSSDSEDNDDDDNANDNANRTSANAVAKNREMLEKRKRFLSRFSTPDLLQMHSVAEFLKEILSWCVRASGYPPEICDIALAAGPARIIQCYNNQNEGLAPLEDILDFFEEELEFHPMVAGYLSLPLEKNLESRGVKPPPKDFTHWYSISGRAEESNSQCTRCHHSFGFELFTRSTFTELATTTTTTTSPFPRLLDTTPNYSFYSSFLPPHPSCLKNNLQHNTPESESLRAEATKHGRGLLLRIWDDLWTWGLVKQETPFVGQYDGVGTVTAAAMATIAGAMGTATTMGMSGATMAGAGVLPDWKEDDYLCQSCFKSFLIENLWVWLRQVKANSAPLAENCWYGYNCRTQTHNLAHAQKLNVHDS